MKRFNLASQIWMLFGAVTLILCLVLSLIFMWTIDRFFAKEGYNNIEYAQELTFAKYGLERSEEVIAVNVKDLDDVRDVRHIVIYDNEYNALNLGVVVRRYLGITPDNPITPEGLDGLKRLIESEKLNDLFLERLKKTESINTGVELKTNIMGIIGGTFSPEILPFISEIKENAIAQTTPVEQYKIQIEDRSLFYVIQNREIEGKKVTLISYLWDTYQTKLSDSLFIQLFFGILIAALLSLVAALLFSKHLVRPLKKLSKNVRDIAKRDWNKPIEVNRKDEIGELAESMEIMRQSLSDQDREQQAMLQYISHELKTPVMVIRSYSQAIKDGIYPKGDLDGSVDVIDKEILRMDQRIKDLLFITRIDYLSRHNMEMEKINLKDLMEDILGKFSLERPEIRWITKLPEIEIEANYEQLCTAIENILQNQLRYANKVIDIKAKKFGKKVELRFYNDGQQIDESRVIDLFAPFKKGIKGENGLGLNIVKKIIELHDGRAWIKNEDDGVATYIELPVKPNEL